MKIKILQFLNDESGATAIEYALLLGFVGVVIVGGLRLMGSAFNGQVVSARSSIPQ